MPQHQDRRELSYTAQQIYDLVADVARYQEFLPWCAASRILRREDARTFHAELVISYKVFRESYVSRVTLTPPDNNGKCAIHTKLERGPFRHLTNHWIFTPSGGGRHCIVDFEVDFQFRSPLLEKVMTAFFSIAAKTMISAFEKRAQDLYGAGAEPATEPSASS